MTEVRLCYQRGSRVVRKQKKSLEAAAKDLDEYSRGPWASAEPAWIETREVSKWTRS